MAMISLEIIKFRKIGKLIISSLHKHGYLFKILLEIIFQSSTKTCVLNVYLGTVKFNDYNIRNALTSEIVFAWLNFMD